jgi:hypothetical protein
MLHLDDTYISTQSRGGFAQILLQQQKISNKQRDNTMMTMNFSHHFQYRQPPSNWCIIGDCVVIITKGLRSGIMHQFGASHRIISFCMLTTSVGHNDSGHVRE